MGDRTLCLWCPDWPVVALRRFERAPLDAPVIVMDGEGAGMGGRVRAASAEARAEGVRRGMRRREAEARCAGALVIAADIGLEARVFEEVARSLDAVTARLAVDRPGLLSFPTRGPVRYFKTEEVVAAQTLQAVHATGESVDARIGVAGSALAAYLAARRTSPVAPVLLLDAPAHDSTTDDLTHDLTTDDLTTQAFLSSRPVAVLSDRGLGELAGLLRRLGIRTLGDLAALPESSVVARFGAEGALAHRLARGLDEGGSALSAPPPDLVETTEMDPPTHRVDIAAFTGRALAERLLDRLAAQGLSLIRVTVEGETEHGERMARVWRFAGPFTAAALTQRIRWQLEAWVGSSPSGTEVHEEATAGLTLLRLVPDEVVPARGHQLDFWAGDARAGERAARVLARLQGMLGHDAVVQTFLRGGRTPAERTGLVPFGDAEPATWQGAALTKGPGGGPSRKREGPAPWPGTVPDPPAALVYDPARPAALVDAGGRPVHVSGRGELSSPPARFTFGDLREATVEQWSGPWTQDVRPWDPAGRRRCALFQVVAGGIACLVSVSGGDASVEALYD